MSLAPQFGDIASRMARLFRIRGRQPYVVDETVIPVALVGDGTGDPYRLAPITWSWPATGTGDATHTGYVAVRCATANACVVIKRFNASAGAAAVTLTWNILRNDSGSGISGGVTLHQAKNQQLQQGPVNENVKAPIAQFANNGTVTPAVNIILGQINIPASGAVQVDLRDDPIVLYQGDVFFLSVTVNAMTWIATIEGADYFPIP